jgi:hypothetical protein
MLPVRDQLTRQTGALNAGSVNLHVQFPGSFSTQIFTVLSCEHDAIIAHGMHMFGAHATSRTWGKQVLSARGFKRVGRHSEYAI